MTNKDSYISAVEVSKSGLANIFPGQMPWKVDSSNMSSHTPEFVEALDAFQHLLPHQR
jgi:hypothetical protein